jgi:integral membrane sensor domain MASE1
MLKFINALTTKASNPMKPFYLLLTIIGSIAPWFWLLQDPTALLSPTLFLQRAFENNISAALTTDLLIAVIAFFCFVWIELKRLDVSRLWIIMYIGLTFGIGLSCALPFFLYRRERILERNAFRQQAA